MPANRWNNLDFEPRPRPKSGAQAPSVAAPSERGTEHERDSERRHEPAPKRSPEHPIARTPEHLNADALPPKVARARGAYLLRNYQAAVDLLEPLLRDRPDLPGGQRVLALALARLNRETEAVEPMAEAIRQSPSDWLAGAALATLLLRCRENEVTASRLRRSVRSPADDAVAHLETALVSAPKAALPAVRELLGAAYWRSGQDALAEHRDREAADRFGASGRQFAEAAAASCAARLVLAPRQAAAFVGQAVALLLSGQLEAAQRLFSRTPLAGPTVTGELGRFAAGLYEFCDELAELPVAERAEAAAALRHAVLKTRLDVAFYDGRQVVSLAWLDGTV